MQIQVHTDNHLNPATDFHSHVEEMLSEKLQRFSSRITRLEVHFSDENSSAKSGGNDKKCVLEARLNGMQPVAVSATADSLVPSLRGAIDKMRAMLDSTLGKQRDT